MLSVRGESILSRLGDDNFSVQDKTTSHNEASFLSLNLHALAEHLEKIDISKRLFIEPDLLPPKQRTEGSNVCSDQKCDQLLSTHDEEPVRRSYEEIIFNDFSSEKVTNGDPNTIVTLFATSDPQ